MTRRSGPPRAANAGVTLWLWRPLMSASVTAKSAEDVRARAHELEQDAVRYPEERGEILLEAAEQWKRAGEVDHAITLLGEVLALGGKDAGFARFSLAKICFKQGADADGWAHLQALEEIEASGWGVAELVAELLEQRGEYGEALRWFDRAISAVDAERLAEIDRRGTVPSLTAFPLFGRQRCRAKLGLPADDLDRAADVADDNRREFVDRLERVAAARAPTPARPRVIEMLVWQRDEQQLAARRWPEVFVADITDQYADIEQRLREECREHNAAKVTLISGSVDGFTGYLERTGDDPAEESVRLAYAGQARDSGRTMTWPPGRNQPCWCGSARKYKKCCGAPATAQ